MNSNSRTVIARPHGWHRFITITICAILAGVALGFGIGRLEANSRSYEMYYLYGLALVASLFLLPLCCLVTIHFRNPFRRSIPAILLQTWGFIATLNASASLFQYRDLRRVEWDLVLIGAPLIAMLFVVPGHFMLRILYRLTIDRRPRCPQCQYDLTGSSGIGCPECGYELEETLRQQIVSNQAPLDATE